MVNGRRGTPQSRPRFAPVRTRVLRDDVLEPIRNAILFGQLPVGHRLVETEIASQMNVSRLPVREALRQLEHEGLVVSAPHRGTVVASVDDGEVEILYRLRAELEAVAVRAAMRRDQAGLVARLRELAAALQAGAQARDHVELAEHDVEFHRAIVEGSGYRILSRVWSSMDGPIRARLHRLLLGPFRDELITYTAESHQPIVDAIATGDGDLAAEAITRHILETKQLADAGVKGRSTADSPVDGSSKQG